MISQFFEVQVNEGQIDRYLEWQDEGSMIAWRVDAKHHTVQETGRQKVFADYRIRIAQVIHEERPEKTAWHPERLSPYNDPKRRPPTFVVATESRNRELPVETSWRRDVFESVYRPGIFAHLVDVPSPDAGVGFGQQLFADSTCGETKRLDLGPSLPCSVKRQVRA